jgi:hypothetical protein
MLAAGLPLAGCEPPIEPEVPDPIPIVGLPSPLVTVHDQGVAWADDGATIAHWVRDNVGQRFRLRRTDLAGIAAGTSSLALYYAWNLAGAPNGRGVAFLGATGWDGGRAVYLALPPEYEPVEIDSAPDGATFLWSDDSQFLAYPIGEGRVAVLDVAARERVITIEEAHVALAFAPGRDRVLVGWFTADGMQLEAVALGDGSRTPMGDLRTPTLQVLVGPVAPLVAFWDQAGVTILHQPGDGVSGRVARWKNGVSTVITTSTSPLNSWRVAAVAPDHATVALWFQEYHATELFSGYACDHLYLLDMASDELRLVANAPDATLGGTVAFAPTGRQLVFFYSTHPGTTGAELYVLRY